MSPVWRGDNKKFIYSIEFMNKIFLWNKKCHEMIDNDDSIVITDGNY